MNQLMIGQFSKLTGVSKRMLRHYEEKGLLEPASIDTFTGYRYYSDSQVTLITNIRLLQSYGFSLSEIHTLLDQPTSLEAFVECLKDKEVLIRNEKDQLTGQLIRIQKSITYLQTSGSKAYLSLEDTQLERNMMMENTTITDAKALLLTLPSYSLFFEYIEERLKDTPGPYYFITFDLDNFASINDVYGYDVGDKTIYQTCALIWSVFKPYIEGGHGQMSRLGGDEFALFFHDVDNTASIQEACQEAIKAIADFDYSQYGGKPHTSSTCGLYISKTVDKIAELRHMSDKALLDGKRNGRNQVYVIEQ